MTIKLIGAFLVFSGCGGFGFAMAAAHRREEETLRQFLAALEYMESDLSCRMTPLPALCRAASNGVSGPVHTFLEQLSGELDAQTASDASACVRSALEVTGGLPQSVLLIAEDLGATLGLFDLPGQLRGLRSAQNRCRRTLDELIRNRDSRLRSYQTLGLCAGAALAILFL